MKSVEEFVRWKNEPGKTLETMLEDTTTALGWDETDTLYSFYGIYAIGLKAYYPKEFECYKNNVTIMSKKGEKVYSNEFIRTNYDKFTKFNNSENLKEFLKNYLTIGNLIPIWPGGNVHKGKSSYDLPEIYFNLHIKMSQALIEVYKHSYMEDIIENKKRLNLHEMLNYDIPQYEEFLSYVVSTINNRNVKIKKILKDM